MKSLEVISSLPASFRTPDVVAFIEALELVPVKLGLGNNDPLWVHGACCDIEEYRAYSRFMESREFALNDARTSRFSYDALKRNSSNYRRPEYCFIDNYQFELF